MNEEEKRLSPEELLAQIITMLRANMLAGRMTTVNDEQFMAWIDAWADGNSAYRIGPTTTAKTEEV